MTQNKLWTYDFTVITIGSFISMVGSTLASFSISLVVLDYTGSTFLYMIFHVCYQLPMVVMPLLAGPYLDRMSRKKMIYTLDYASAGIFALMYLLLQSGWMNYALLLGGSVALGAINGVYTVAYDSFYPNLISPGNAQRAYSVSSMPPALSAESATRRPTWTTPRPRTAWGPSGDSGGTSGRE